MTRIINRSYELDLPRKQRKDPQNCQSEIGRKQRISH
jgi:hypothetical protein